MLQGRAAKTILLTLKKTKMNEEKERIIVEVKAWADTKNGKKPEKQNPEKEVPAYIEAWAKSKKKQ